jgi:L-galactose dehydrogenase
MGLLTAAGPPAWHPAPQPLKDAAEELVRFLGERRIAPSLVSLRFCIDYPHAASTLVGMSSVQEVQQNVAALSYQLDASLVQQIDALVAPVRDLTWPSGRPENSDA